LPASIELEILHGFSFENESLVSSSVKCGCFYCGRVFDKEEIHEWIDDTKGRTAVCPYCGIDSVLPDSNVDLNDELLLQMRVKWFEEQPFNDTPII